MTSEILNQPIQIRSRWVPPAEEGKPYHATVRFSQAEKRRLRKKKSIPVSQWAERHIFVPAESSIPGKWRKKTTPYLAGIMDASFFPSVREIIICAPPQTGKTVSVIICVMYATDRKPGNCFFVFHDEKATRDVFEDKIQSIIRQSPRMRQYMTPYHDDLTVKKIKLEHVVFYSAWASSAGTLSTRSGPYGVADEEDQYAATPNKKEAGPVDLLKDRARTYPRTRKLWRMSKPTVETGPIWKALNNDAEVVFVYYVKCPQCSAGQQMQFTRDTFKWPAGERDPDKIEKEKLAWYECIKCHCKWDDAARDMAVRAGQWRDRDKGIALDTYLAAHRPQKIGFHYPAWLSIFVSMSEAAAAFLRGQKDFTKLKAFKNAYESVPWEEQGEQPEWEKLAVRPRNYPRGTVPSGGLVLTGACDVQHNRLEAVVKAWGRGEESWLILHEVIWGDPQQDAVWDELDKIVNTGFAHTGGIEMRIVSFGVDSSDGVTTQAVRRYCYTHRFGQVVFALKGASQANKPILGRPTAADLAFHGKPIPGGVQQWPIGTDIAKALIYRRLEISNPGPGCMHFYQDLPQEYFEQLVAEKRVTETAKWGHPKTRWVLPAGRRNEALDLEVYTYAAAVRAGVSRMRNEDWDALEEDYLKQEQPRPKQKQKQATGRKSRRW